MALSYDIAHVHKYFGDNKFFWLYTYEMYAILSLIHMYKLIHCYDKSNVVMNRTMTMTMTINIGLVCRNVEFCSRKCQQISSDIRRQVNSLVKYHYYQYERR